MTGTFKQLTIKIKRENMMKKTNKTLVTLLLMVLFSNASIAKNQCIDVGGSALGNIVNGGKSIIAAMNGTFSSVRGEITSSKETPTGIFMTMEHIFMQSDGGLVATKDDVVLTSVKGKESQYMINVTYHVQEDKTNGSLKGVKGLFKSYGLIDLSIGEVVIRYEGNICK